MSAPSGPGDFWLKAATQVGPFSGAAPSDQQVADLLARQPCSGWTAAGETPFMWELIDRPEPGTAAFTFLQPGRQPPPDGLRYLPASPAERFTSSSFTINAPSSAQNPSHLIPTQVTLECHSYLHGHFPPTSRNSGLLPDSPELRLCRYRRRWRITKGAGHPALWLFYWGRDSTGGSGQGEAPSALPGWEREPVRAYPLSKNAPTDPVWIFGSKTRQPGPPGQLAAAGGAGGAPPAMGGPMGGPMGGSMGPMGGMMAGGGMMGPAGQQHAFPSASLDANRPGQSQQQFAQQQQQALALQQAYRLQASGGSAASGGSGQPGQPSAASYQQLQSHQQAMMHSQAQAQAKASQLQAQQAHQLAIQQQQLAAQQQRSRGATGGNGGKDHEEAQAALLAASGDILDALTTRQISIARFSKNHELLAGVFDPWTTTAVLEGKKRRKEDGEGRDRGGLSRLAIEAVPVRGPPRPKVDVEERRKVLERMLGEAEGEIGKLEDRHREQTQGLGQPLPGVVSVWQV
ncbi:hypothetical protein RQP46_006520 [Phenoliferia psychrophenolica]